MNAINTHLQAAKSIVQAELGRLDFLMNVQGVVLTETEKKRGRTLIEIRKMLNEIILLNKEL